MRPDIVVSLDNARVILDITCPFESGPLAFEQARYRKIDHYAPGAEAFYVNGNEKTFTTAGKSIVSCLIEQKETGLMSLVIKPDGGSIIVCGVILSPV